MKFTVVPHIWDDVLHEYRPIPLDDASKEIIQLANLVHGHEMTTRQFNRILTRLGIDADEIGGVV